MVKEKERKNRWGTVVIFKRCSEEKKPNKESLYYSFIPGSRSPIFFHTPLYGSEEERTLSSTLLSMEAEEKEPVIPVPANQ